MINIICYIYTIVGVLLCCLLLGGPCRAGKSTLASVLIGEEIPLKWNSTDGLVIYFGRNGINIEKKEMIPLEKGTSAKMLFGTKLMFVFQLQSNKYLQYYEIKYTLIDK